MWFRIALRNLSRNRRRTLLTLGVIALGTAMSFGLAGYMEDALGKLRTETVRQFGNFQIAEPLFWDDNVGGQAAMIEPEYRAQVEEAIAQYSENQEYSLMTTPQTELSGLLTDGGGIYSRVVTMIAFDPANEALNYNDIVMLDRPNPNDDDEIPGIEPGVTNAVLIGESLANEFNLDVGHQLRFATRTITNQVILLELFVQGIFQRNDQKDESGIVYVPLADAENLLRTDNVSKLVVSINDIDETERVIDDIQARLNDIADQRNQEAREAYEQALAEYEASQQESESGDGENGESSGSQAPPGSQFGGPQPPQEPTSIEPLQIKSWQQLSTYYQQVSGFFDALFAFLTFAVILLVFFIVYQVLSMSFLERTREVGTIRAIGTKRQQVFTMFISESVILGVLGGLIGLGLGFVLAQVVNAAQFGWTPPGAIREVPVELSLGLNNALLPFVISAVATLLSALLPSIHSARIQIVEALRTN